ncbi:hypothetical protein DC522_29295 [Microvirga sp. KLBC 81]|uniref:hypothetical protein n=1 Tax=Microvirga sp. KLBC 81 TaxID=1862707 RepID=UPI000D517A91|nr:hypothetical protein [Microvirga sp. KLBC 81]PVE20953.1 hypothetical protein DC522_29295 [Microvirga sp. KLBC 81]
MLAQTAGEKRYDFAEVAVIGITAFLLVVIMFRLMGTSVLQSDVLGYSLQSQHWWQANWHLPGYAILLWALRALTFNTIGDVLLMQTICLAAWSGSLWVFFQIAEHVNPAAARLGAMIYGLYPFVGITLIAWPLSDMVANFALIYAVLCLYERDWPRLTLAIAAMLLMQKALWPFSALIGLVAWRRGFPLWRVFGSGVPLVLFWLFVAVNGEGLLWIVSVDMSKHFSVHTSLPLLDGILGTLMRGDVRGITKGLILLGLLFGTGAMTWIYGRRGNLEMIAILIPVLGLLVVLNEWVIWAAFRYSKILVIPLIGLLPQSYPSVRRLARAPRVFWICVVILVASQLAFAMRIEIYFRNDISGENYEAAKQGNSN